MPTTPTRPRIDAGRAAALTRELWGLGGELRELGSYDDRNFALTTAGGERYVVKLSHTSTMSPEVIALQLAALRHLATGPCSSLVPRVIASRAGRDQAAVEDDEGEACTMWVLGWIPGRLWGELESVSPALCRSLGAGLACLDRELEDFHPPALAGAMKRPLIWNLAEAEWIAAELDAVEAGPRRALVVDTLAQFRARVAPRLAELPHQLIHGDANEHNLIVEGEELRGIIDFGDTVWAPTICELAIALAYAGMAPDAVSVCAEVCVGYHERRPISELELDLLYDLVRARLAVSVVNSARLRKGGVDNPHSFVSEAPAWAWLGKLTEFGRRAITKYIAGACGLTPPLSVPGARPRARLLSQRRVRLGPSLSLSYAEPLYIRRGEGTWLFDEHDRAYLDCVNNVCHVGHCHPRVVAAASEQLAALNTNTRYLHEAILAYADRLCATLPRQLSVVFMVNSGSEANELALRIARAHTGGEEVVVVDGGYHGNTGTLTELSPYKLSGDRQPKPGVHVLATPDPYRGRHGAEGPAYAAQIERAAGEAAARGGKLAAFLAEPVMGCAGQIVPAPGFLAAAYEQARAAGAVCIADEVQVGFGRLGAGMWAFESEQVVPDILTLGKPIANGMPVGAVVTTAELAASFAATGLEYFNTFGGNPVACAAASAVLKVIADEGLVAHAREVGASLLAGLRALADPGVGEVRGRGLFLGVELVEPPEAGAPPDQPGAPDAARARKVVEWACNHGVLLSTDGPARNVIKIKPPMCFAEVEAKILLATLAAALREDPPSPPAAG